MTTRFAIAAVLGAIDQRASIRASNYRSALTLHYDKPASTWTEARPVGNGRLVRW